PSCLTEIIELTRPPCTQSHVRHKKAAIVAAPRLTCRIEHKKIDTLTLQPQPQHFERSASGAKQAALCRRRALKWPFVQMRKALSWLPCNFDVPDLFN
ncbi:MAG TPA: hypothetical protein DIW43_11965, partial [Spongiibacteraceae bacterium]|nr:hypothetical protein [Spongiibacteraceae bacterium]